VIGNWWTKKRR